MTLLFVIQVQAFFIQESSDYSEDSSFVVSSAEQCYGLWSVGPEASEFAEELQLLASASCQIGAYRVSEISVVTTYKGAKACSIASAQYKCITR